MVEGEGGLEALGLEDDKEEYLYVAFYKSESARVTLSVCLSVCLLVFVCSVGQLVVSCGHVWSPTVLSGLRRQEDSWVFEEPVTESIAPGYHELISMPMDYSTVESRLEKKHYSNREEVSQPAPTLCGRCVCTCRL